jgi:hypothetical protein
MTVLGSLQYLVTMLLVISSMFFGWPPIAILVIPGKSTMVKSGQSAEKTVRTWVKSGYDRVVDDVLVASA